jgi:hypothetical protein
MIVVIIVVVVVLILALGLWGAYNALVKKRNRGRPAVHRHPWQHWFG